MKHSYAKTPKNMNKSAAILQPVIKVESLLAIISYIS